MKIVVYSLLLLSALGCSSKWSNFFNRDDDHSERNRALMKKFNVDKEVLAKFEEKESTPVVNTKAAAKESSAQVTTAEKPLPVSKPVTSPAPKRSEIRPTLEKAQKLGAVVPQVESEYPPKYPEQYPKMSTDSVAIWKKYSPVVFEGEESVFDINYLGVSTGKVVLSTKPSKMLGDQRAYHFNAKIKTSRYYSYLYELDDTIDSFMSMQTYMPLKFSLIQRESGQDVDELQLFDLEQLKVYHFFQRVTKSKEQKKQGEKFTPKYYQDPLSVIHFVRGLPMAIGNQYHIPIVNKGKADIMHFKVMDKEKLKTKIGEKEAWVLEAETKYTGEKLKKGKMHFWFSTDSKRIFLKFEAKISIGHISGDIESYKE